MISRFVENLGKFDTKKPFSEEYNSLKEILYQIALMTVGMNQNLVNNCKSPQLFN